MAKPVKKRFAFRDESNLDLGADSDDVADLQTMLGTFGYLRDLERQGHYCVGTQRAVRRFQRFYKLEADGIAGPITKGLLQRPRCGVPDIFTSPGGATAAAPFVHRGCKYNKNSFTYAFLNETSDLANSRATDIVTQAFRAWEAVADLRFAEIDPSSDPDFRVAWRRSEHGDGSPFDGLGGPQGNTLAHAFYPPPCGGPHAGDLHFDEDETWVDDPTASGILLLQVAIHEIGHLLGLAHSEETEAIMFAFYAPDRVNLSQDDVEGVVGLYGRATETRQVQIVGSASGSLLRAADEASFEVRVPEELVIKLDGPDDADFDLYVRKGSPPTTSEWDFRAYTVSSDEAIRFPAETGASYFVMVRSYSGDGDFTLRVEPG